MSGTRTPSQHRELIAATANLTISAFDAGKTFTNYGAGGSVTFTLPDPLTCRFGDEIIFQAAAAQNLVIAAPSGKLITFNNIAATSVTLSTSSELIGGGFWVTCYGDKWHVMMMLEETQTVTVA